MDVGAGTLDLAAFNVANDIGTEDTVYPIFSAKVSPLGTHYLMERRVSGSGIANATWSDSQHIPSVDTLSDRWNVEPSRLEHIDTEFRRNVRAEIVQLLTYTKNQRYQLSRNWTDGLPVFLVGGGASVSVYREALENALNAKKIPLIAIGQEIPAQLRSTGSTTSTDFSRLTVAYGLAIDPAISGRIRPANTITNEAPRRIRKQLSHEELYS